MLHNYIAMHGSKNITFSSPLYYYYYYYYIFSVNTILLGGYFPLLILFIFCYNLFI